MRFQLALEKITSKPRIIFLIDGLGALLSVFLLGGLLTSFESIFGMPRTTLIFLASLPVIFVVYDFYCFLRVNQNQGSFLRAIAMANILYSFISMTMVIYHFQKLTFWGLIYFLLEILIVLTLAGIELKTVSILKAEQA